jgi:class 3 adenylate cyclase
MRTTIASKILGAAIALITLMALASSLSFYMADEVGFRIDRLSTEYIPAYGQLARANVISLEQALALRRLLLAAKVIPPNQDEITALHGSFDAKGAEFREVLGSARSHINAEIGSGNAFADPIELARIDARIGAVLDDDQRHYTDEVGRLLKTIGVPTSDAFANESPRVEAIRDEINQHLEGISGDLYRVVRDAAQVTRKSQTRVVVIGAVLTTLAAALGLVVSALISGGLVRPLRRLLEGTRAVESGRLEVNVPVRSHDEVGRLTEAFNRMTEQLRVKERIRETFGKYIDPRVVEGLIDRPMLTQGEGQRRMMTVLFCDMKGFTAMSEGMTPQGLVKVMNRYLTTMSEPIRDHRGVIDKYVGDAIMAYWGPPFTDDSEQAGLACLAALDMLERLEPLHREVMELLGMRIGLPRIDMRIGIATGDALVGNIGSDFMMSYTVMGDTVNFASRLESANKVYDNRILIAGTTAAAAASYVETREIDRVVVTGTTEPHQIFEVMSRKSALTPAQAALRQRFGEGLEAYRAMDWDVAKAAFMDCLKIVPADGPSATFLSRIDTLEVTPPPRGWDGTWVMAHK